MELPFVLEAVQEGEGVIRFTTRSDVLNEVLEDTVKVERPLVTEAFATIGAILDGDNDGGEVPSVHEALVVPQHAAEGFGGLNFTADSTLMPHIQPALDNITSVLYPSLNDELYALIADLALKGRARDKDKVFDALEDLQFPDGGIGYRPPTVDFARSSWFLSALTAYAALEIERYEGPFDSQVDRERPERLLGIPDEGSRKRRRAVVSGILECADSRRIGRRRHSGFGVAHECGRSSGHRGLQPSCTGLRCSEYVAGIQVSL